MGVSIHASFTRGGSDHLVAIDVVTPEGENTILLAKGKNTRERVLTIAHGRGYRRHRQVLGPVLGKQSCLNAWLTWKYRLVIAL